MTENHTTYRESLFQWVWEHLEFDCRHLYTTCGKRLEIADPGIINHGAGPDFFQARLLIDGTIWHGSVEIHKTASGWNSHHHEEDRNFNNVILHVVYSDNRRQNVLRKDGTSPFTLCLEPYMDKELSKLLSLQNESVLPCGKRIAFINQEAFERQIEKTHKEYFNVKVNELLHDFNPSLPLSEAWKQALISGLYNSLGIPANCDQMKQLALKMFSEDPAQTEPEDFLSLAEQKARSAKDGLIEWKENGMRPASLPRKRIPQAAVLHHSIHTYPFKNFLHSGIGVWNEILETIPAALRPGKTRLSILKNTVFLPAIYLLGDLFHSGKLLQTAYAEWRVPPQNIPREIIEPFRKAGFSIPSAARKFGLAHQYKRYCQRHQCQRCEVFKSAIRS